MSNTQYGLICDFYQNTEANFLPVERKLREGFISIGKSLGNFNDKDLVVGNVTKTELEGSRFFKKRFGKKPKSLRELKDLLIDLKLVSSERDIPVLIEYLLNTDIPYRCWFLLEPNDWNLFRLIKLPESEDFRLCSKSFNLGIILNTWYELLRPGPDT